MNENAEQSLSPDAPAQNRMTLAFGDVKEALQEAFDGEYERRWVSEAWAALIMAGPADYSNELERCEAAIRFIALIEFYRDWRSLVDEGDRGFAGVSVATVLNLSPFRLGQLIGRHPEFTGVPRFDLYTIRPSDDELFCRALYHLEIEARSAVAAAMKLHFGGISGLFLALWNGDKQPRPADYEWNREKYHWQRDWGIQNLHTWVPAYQDSEDEILMDETAEKMRLWTWLDQGAEPLDRY